MRDTVVVTLPRFLSDARHIADCLNADIKRYSPSVFSEIFPCAGRIVALMSMGIAIRGIAPLLHDKWSDPAVVVVSPGLAFAVPLIGGHHGANSLAKELSVLGILPVITTATEAFGKESVESIAQRHGCGLINRESSRLVNGAILDRDVPVYPIAGPAVVVTGPGVSVLAGNGEYIVGIGCKKGVKEVEVTKAIRQAITESGITGRDILVYATTAKKLGEKGLSDAVAGESGTLIFLNDDTINAQKNAQKTASPSRAARLGLVGVAEPCALALAHRKKLVMKKTVFGRVTIAIAH